MRSIASAADEVQNWSPGRNARRSASARPAELVKLSPGRFLAQLVNAAASERCVTMAVAYPSPAGEGLPACLCSKRDPVQLSAETRSWSLHDGYRAVCKPDPAVGGVGVPGVEVPGQNRILRHEQPPNFGRGMSASQDSLNVTGCAPLRQDRLAARCVVSRGLAGYACSAPGSFNIQPAGEAGAGAGMNRAGTDAHPQPPGVIDECLHHTPGGHQPSELQHSVDQRSPSVTEQRCEGTIGARKIHRVSG